MIMAQLTGVLLSQLEVIMSSSQMSGKANHEHTHTHTHSTHTHTHVHAIAIAFAYM